MSSNYSNFCLIISSPSGAGKSTVCQEILKKYNDFEMSISMTTRTIREYETNGKEYFFVDKNYFVAWCLATKTRFLNIDWPGDTRQTRTCFHSDNLEW